MAESVGINLFSTTVEKNPELERITTILRQVSYGGLILLIASGLIVGGLFGYLTIQRDSLTNSKADLTTTIAQQSTKEGLLLAVKERASVVKKVMGLQKKIDPLFSDISQIVVQGQIGSISLDDNNTVLVVANSGSVRDAAKIVSALLGLTNGQKVNNPKLVSLTLSKDGSIDVAVSFVPVL